MIETGVAQIENFRPLHVQVLSIRTLFGNIALGVCEGKKNSGVPIHVMKRGGDISLGEESIYHLPFEKKCICIIHALHAIGNRKYYICVNYV